MAYECEQCGASFQKLSQLKHHQRTENHWKKFNCDECGKWFTRKDNLDQHKKKHIAISNVHCDECGQVFSRHYTLQRHKDRVHQTGGGQKRAADVMDPQDEPVKKRLTKNDNPRDFFTLIKVKEQQMEKFRTKATTYKVNILDLEVTENILMTLRKLFQSVFDELTKEAKSGDLVRFTVQSSSLDYPIVIPFLKIQDLTADRFMAELERVLQSNEDFVIDTGLIIEVTLVNMPNGGTRKRCRFVNTDKFLFEKKCIIRIQNDDELCCARAIVTAKARLDLHEKWNYIRQGRCIQGDLARQLHEEAGVPLGKCGIEEVNMFQKVLSGYQIHVVSKDHFNGIIFSGPEADNKLYLYFHEDHYDVITSMSAFLSRNYFCIKCNKGYDHPEDHRCNNVCHCCCKVHEQDQMDWIQCNKCQRFFKGPECFELHERTTSKGNSTCSNLYRCQDCGKTVNRKIDKKHVCGQVFCKQCDEFYPDGHRCYMKPEEQDFQQPMSIDEEIVDEIENAKTFIFFDFECRADNLLECDQGYSPDLFGKCTHCLKATCGSFHHTPNLCVAQKVCTVCMETSEKECEDCGQREYVFTGDNTLDNFCAWLFSEDNYGSTVLCHNFQGYDSYPVLQYLYKNAVLPIVVPNGAKIICLTVTSCKIKMVDSINFLPMALAKLPVMFGFTELKKGYFPHLFNTKKNQSVILQGLPDISYYNADSMKPEERENFLFWYNEHKYDHFDFQQELLEYCRSDVDILRRCALKFRDDFLDITGIDPYERCITIASACNLMFRANFFKRKYHRYNSSSRLRPRAETVC